mgnify:CR=1 FL=1
MSSNIKIDSNTEPTVSSTSSNVLSIIEDKIKDWKGVQNKTVNKRELELWPFLIVAVGNGKTEDLYKFFGPFYAESNGVISKKFNQALYLEKSLGDESTIIGPLNEALNNLKKIIPDLPDYTYVDLLILHHQFSAFTLALGKEDNEIRFGNIITDRIVRFWEKEIAQKKGSGK